MIKRRQGGSTFMVMFFGFQSISLCLQHPLVLVLSCSHCKNLLRLFLPSVLKFLNSFFVRVAFSILYTPMEVILCFMLVQYNLHFYASTGWCVLSI